MEDLRYLHNKDKFLEYAWDVLKSYFSDLTDFNMFFDSIVSDSRKNNFLRATSFYKFLVKDGTFLCYLEQDPSSGTRIPYFDETYKFIAIFALIESLIGELKYDEFHVWLAKKHDFKNDPISSKSKFRKLHSEYLKEYGSTGRAIKFFTQLDEGTKKFLISKITVPRISAELAIETLANMLYELRSQFVHNCRLVLEIGDGRIISQIREEFTVTSLTLQDLKLIFERGLLGYFGYSFAEHGLTHKD